MDKNIPIKKGKEKREEKDLSKFRKKLSKRYQKIESLKFKCVMEALNL